MWEPKSGRQQWKEQQFVTQVPSVERPKHHRCLDGSSLVWKGRLLYASAKYTKMGSQNFSALTKP